MSESKKIYEPKKYFAIALDPIYVGTGGYRIGRVDNTIIREPATDIPKIPATSIEGVCRNHAYLKAMERDELNEDTNKKTHPLACAKGKKVKVNGEDKYPCGKCRICITFGYTKEGEALQAMALFSDARILFFPVATMIGPVWITCPMALKEGG
ncbi:RAMP superfamily CRISPR-associated protein [Thermococcus sp.]